MNRRDFLQVAAASAASLSALSCSNSSESEQGSQGTGKITVEAANALVFRGGKHEVAHNVYLTLEGNQISEIADSRPAETGTLIRPSNQHLVMPGLIDTHSHASSALVIRGEVENGWTDVNSIWLPFEYIAKLDSQEQIDALNQWALLEVLKSGTTTILESSLNVRHARSVAVQAEKIGIRTYTVPFLPGMHRLNEIMFRWDNKTLEDSMPETERELEEVLDMVRTYNAKADGLVRVGLGPEECTNVTAPFLQKIVELAEDLDCIIGMHPTSQGGDRRVVQMYGKGTLPFLDDIGALSDRLILYGGGRSEADYQLITDSGTSVAYDEFSHLYRSPLRSSYLPLKRAGINLALGSNSLMLDLVAQMKWMAYLTQSMERSFTYAVEEDLVSMATLGGAKALRRPDLGRLEKGARADLIIVNLGRSHNGPLSEENPLRNLVRYSSGADVETVIVNGKVLIEDGQPQFDVDPEMPSIVQKTKAQIWKDLEKEVTNKRYPGMRDDFEEWQEQQRRKSS
jgi:cytosine/adenosine deaminase-related metal-dependent hydrolase